MPVHVNSIGSFTFFDLDGDVFLRQQGLEIIDRPGVPGSGARRLAERGQPFVLKSTQYYEDWTDFRTTLASYVALVGQDPQTVIQFDEDWGTYLVLTGVVALEKHAVMNVAGAPGKTVRAVVRWPLLG